MKAPRGEAPLGGAPGPRAKGATIVAVASAGGSDGGRGERAVLRLSGPQSGALVRSLCRLRSQGRGAPELGPRCVLEISFHDGTGPVPGRLLWMPGPRSFTAEDVAELHVPGHPGLVGAALGRLLEGGARLAEPGEFTRRAFENGRIDLTQAEGVAALVAARSETERRAATALLVGGLGRRIRGIRAELEAVRALSEASLDFDEADTGHVPTEQIVELATGAQERIEEALGWERQRSAAGASARVVLAGDPNAGKSTLFNRLASLDPGRLEGPAIVSDLSGTTRDAKAGDWQLTPDLRVTLLDTAGLGADAPTESEPDRLATARAVELVQSADLVLWLMDAGAAHPPEPPAGLDLGPGGRDENRVQRVLSKVDLAAAPRGRAETVHGLGTGALAISSATGQGLGELAACVVQRLGFEGSSCAQAQGGQVLDGQGLGARHLAALQEAALRIAGALGAIGAGVALDLVAEDLRLATDSLDQIAGRTVPEDLLDRIFAQFCLGK